MKARQFSQIELNEIVQLYTNKICNSTHELAKRFNTSHKVIKQILINAEVPINNKGGQLKYNMDEANSLTRFVNNNNVIAVCKKTQKRFNDYENRSGALTSHIKDLYPHIEIPSKYKRKMVFKSTGKYWHEQYFDLECGCEITPTKKCQYCEWETIDVNNQSGAYVNHLLKRHNKTIQQYLLEFPNDEWLFTTFKNAKERKMILTDENNYVVCHICGKKMKAISNTHLKTHNITPENYKLQYSTNMLSNTLTAITAKRLNQYNYDNNIHRYVSKDENEIKSIIENCGFNVVSNDRKILNGKEIDILIPQLHLGIEFNGNKFHTEYYGGKYPNYHYDKLIEANKKGYNLIQIFEDEWMLNREIVINKLLHLIGKSNGKKIGARKCEIRPILTHEKNAFLDTFHIQGHDMASIKIGAYYGDILVGVMTFKPITTTEFELNRFATNFNYIIAGLGHKMLMYFIRSYQPKKIISFADRRWTLSTNENLYVKLGFTLCGIVKPDYKYYNNKTHRYKRFHKFMFRKKNMCQKYGFSMKLTEQEMTQQLGYDRIWDCGLLKYEMNL